MAIMPNDIIINIRVNYTISFWQAVKLRIAGETYQQVAKEIMKTLKEASNGID